ncbi:class I SAM-dependent methyltransferase [Parachitinimonas caeni]|uniref:Methyltransferase domain-containing protein n=1 Tax=Parachitinimonas caeni TaxID=3031301 RepID=A0ABT7DZE0_9NEIS|nr:class I SAM-dependent methyltransferase [Parachitinimonas caeni]MDK2125431.1 methyltransferase domain-containing protein [Parachitinimonas caeni]
MNDRVSLTSLPVNSLVIGFAEKPYDLFLLKVAGVELVGIKSEARFEPEGPVRKCSLVEAHMVKGRLLATRVTAQGYTAYYQPLPHNEISRLFEQAAQDPQASLSYPFAKILPGGEESVPPPDAWDPDPDFAEELDRDEVYFRATAVSLLEQLGLQRGVVYDPACSTGAFLSGLKQAYGGLVTIGQDRNPGMAALARQRVDQVFCGDSIQPAPAAESVDLLVLRHLNVEVVTAADAASLFLASASTLRAGGYCLVFGHTPVQLPAAWFEMQGFEVLSSVAATPARHALFEFYLLRKGQSPQWAA